MIELAFLRHDPNEEAARASAARATPHDAVTAAETTTRRQWGNGVKYRRRAHHRSILMLYHFSPSSSLFWLQERVN